MNNKDHLGTKDHVTYLKGIAILAVIGIHTINSFIAFFDPKTFNWNLLIFLDQLFRFSVPLFIAISGYSLAKKYSNKTLQFNEFFRNRVAKLIPLYVVWSLIYIITSKIIPGWNPFSYDDPIWKVLVLGRAEYHLYFVPMIFQAYLLFPLIFPFIKKFPFLMLSISLILQIIFFNKINTNSWNDQMQYILLMSWQFYFILGIFLSSVSAIFLKIISTLFVLIGFVLMFGSFSSNFEATRDIIWSTKFTRLPVLIYSTGVIIILLLSSRFSRPVTIINHLGKYSYGIYLGHVFFLHLVMSFLVKAS